MAMSAIQRIYKDAEISKRRVQKRKDVRDLRSAGVYNNGRDHYLNKDDHPRDGVEIPHWFRNLSKAWQSNKRSAAQRRREKLNPLKSNSTIADDWNEWCDDRVDMLGKDYDPRKHKRKVGRPKLPSHLKKNPGKIKRSDQMRQLLVDNDIAIKSVGRDEFLIEHPDWEFLPNGRLRYQKSQPISVHRFLQDHDLIPM